jgi:hypothetical protein
MCHVTVIYIAIDPLTSKHTAAGILVETEQQEISLSWIISYYTCLCHPCNIHMYKSDALKIQAVCISRSCVVGLSQPVLLA